MTMKKLPLIDKIAYGFGDLGNGLAMQVVGSYLVFFMTSILHIPGTISGLAIGVSIFWDAITDPIMGYISDNTRSKKYGRRHGYLLIGAIGVSFSILGLFFIPLNASLSIKVLLIFIFIISYKTFITILVTPYTALGSELSQDYAERTQIQSIRSIFFMAGVALMMVGGMYVFFQPTDQYPIGQLNPQAYTNIAIFSAVASLIAILVVYFKTRKYIGPLSHHHGLLGEASSIKLIMKTFMDTYKNRAFVFVATAYMFSNIATAIVNNIGIHVFTYAFAFDSTMIAIVIGVQFLFAILSQPLWVFLVDKTDKKSALLLGLFITFIAAMIFLLISLFHNSFQQNFWIFMPYAIIAGIGTGAMFSIPSSMVGDTIDVEELKTGIRNEGVYFGSMTLFYKSSQAIVVFLLGILLDLIGFNSHLTVQAPFTQLALGLILSLGCGFAVILSSWSIYKYPLSKKRVLEIREQLSSPRSPTL
jgi:GPH family glycoside/pentoside/hexuronide:cation symporter